jgi:ribonuclease H2 subunit B
MTPIDPAFLLIPILQAIKPVSKQSEPYLRDCAYCLLQNDGSAGIFQPLDDIFDEAVPKIVLAVNGTASDDVFPHIIQEDMLFLTGCDCIVSSLKRLCDFQSAPYFDFL